MQLMLIIDIYNSYFIRRIKKVQGINCCWKIWKEMRSKMKVKTFLMMMNTQSFVRGWKLIFFDCVLCCISLLNSVHYFIFRSKRVASIHHIVGWSVGCLIGLSISECIKKCIGSSTMVLTFYCPIGGVNYCYLGKTCLTNDPWTFQQVVFL